mmetsp:Transcript_38549/g.110248  ORF Transcript_38549/g.110248 Transcript_38549/m.110248 type:complete len:238 (+) Transcript_38549:700-1413(+)
MTEPCEQDEDHHGCVGAVHVAAKSCRRVLGLEYVREEGAGGHQEGGKTVHVLVEGANSVAVHQPNGIPHTTIVHSQPPAQNLPQAWRLPLAHKRRSAVEQAEIAVAQHQWSLAMQMIQHDQHEPPSSPLAAMAQHEEPSRQPLQEGTAGHCSGHPLRHLGNGHIHQDTEDAGNHNGQQAGQEGYEHGGREGCVASPVDEAQVGRLFVVVAEALGEDRRDHARDGIKALRLCAACSNW